MPLALFEGLGYALDKAIDLAQNHINDAKKKNDNLIERCKDYLTAAKVAIIGLESEYDEIIVQTENLDYTKEHQINLLKFRIGKYMTVDKLRILLVEANQGIESCRKKLKVDAEKWLTLPKTREKKHQTIEEIDILLKDLKIYLKELNSQGLKYRLGGSGIGINWLAGILEVLNDSSVNKKSEIKSILKRAHLDRRKDRLLDFTERITKTIEEVYSYF